jgi:hypothetical protein
MVALDRSRANAVKKGGRSCSCPLRLYVALYINDPAALEGPLFKTEFDDNEHIDCAD